MLHPNSPKSPGYCRIERSTAMASISQIEANRRNSQSSSGPRTESGKSNSSKNRLTYGLYTHEDYVRPGEAEIYAEFCQTMYDRLLPDNLLEETFVFEITGASWRLRRCAAAEAELADYCSGNDETARPYRHECSSQNDANRRDPLLDDATDKTRRSIERARSAAHSIINRSLNQLRKLQTERIIRELLDYGGADDTIAAEVLKLVAAQKADAREQQRAAEHRANQIIESIENMPFPPTPPSQLASNCSSPGDTRISGASPAVPELASNCKKPSETTPPVPGKAA